MMGAVFISKIIRYTVVVIPFFDLPPITILKLMPALNKNGFLHPCPSSIGDAQIILGDSFIISRDIDLLV